MNPQVDRVYEIALAALIAITYGAVAAAVVFGIR